MKLLAITFALIFALFALIATLNGNVALGLPVLVVTACSVGALLAGAEGIGLAVILLGLGLGWLVSWWICPFVTALGLALIRLDPNPVTPIGCVVSEIDWIGGADGAGGGGGDGGG